MFTAKINIFMLCKEFLEVNCDSNRLKEKENILLPFSTNLTKDENNNYSISDNEFSIKCILKEEALKKFRAENSDDIEQIKLISNMIN